MRRHSEECFDSCNGKLLKWSGAGSSESSGEENRVSVLAPAGSERQSRFKSRHIASLVTVLYFGNTLGRLKREEIWPRVMT